MRVDKNIREKSNLNEDLRKKMSITEHLIDYVCSTGYENLPNDSIVAAKRLIMNTFCAILCGSGAEGVKEVASLVKDWGGKEEGTIFLNDTKAPAHEAVLVNATMARAQDFDEFNFQTGLHTGGTVLPVALAAAETCGGVDGKNLITAVVVGVEVMCRMRLVPDFCIGVSGWAGEVYGAFGGAITAGKVLGLTKEKVVDALGLAYSQAAGNAQPIYDGSLATRLQQGFSARAGLLSVILATHGITGPQNFLEGKAGFYPVYYRGMDYDMSRLCDGIGEKYELMNIATKPYPCCGFLMAPIENALDIMRQNNVNQDDISKVVVRINQQMYNTVGMPTETKYRPKSAADAMFSLPYVVGVAILRGDVLLEDFSVDAISDPERLNIANKVEMIVDEDINRESKELHCAFSPHELAIETGSGRHFSQKLYHAKGFPQKPMTMEDFTEKAKKCSHYAIKPFPDRSIEDFFERVEHLEKQNDIGCLTRLLF